jgi:hypothetical protein
MLPTDPDGGNASLTGAQREWRTYHAGLWVGHEAVGAARLSPASMARCQFSRAPLQCVFSFAAWSVCGPVPLDSSSAWEADAYILLQTEHLYPNWLVLAGIATLALLKTNLKRHHPMQTSDHERSCFNPYLACSS